MTTLFDDTLFPADCFGELYYKRWGIEEAFKRLKHRLNLEQMLRKLLELIAGKTYRHREDRLKPRTQGAKPHKKMTQKNC